jgi:hypothetical protein
MSQRLAADYSNQASDWFPHAIEGLVAPSADHADLNRAAALEPASEDKEPYPPARERAKP